MSTTTTTRDELKRYLSGLDWAAFTDFCLRIKMPIPRKLPDGQKWKKYCVDVLLAAEHDHPTWYVGILRVAKLSP